MSSISPNMSLAIPDINDDISTSIPDIAANFTYLDKIWPVGSLYLSTASTNPGNFLGGTWSRIQDRFLLAAGTTYTAGSTGGAATHWHGKAEDGSSITTVAPVSGQYVVGKGNHTQTASSLPPYIAVYVWERTA